MVAGENHIIFISSCFSSYIQKRLVHVLLHVVIIAKQKLAKVVEKKILSKMNTVDWTNSVKIIVVLQFYFLYLPIAGKFLKLIQRYKGILF